MQEEIPKQIRQKKSAREYSPNQSAAFATRDMREKHRVKVGFPATNTNKQKRHRVEKSQSWLSWSRIFKNDLRY